MGLLQAAFLVQLLPAWSSNLGIRPIRSPKLIMNDTGLAASLIGLAARRLQAMGNSLIGNVIENFAIMEIIKDIGVSSVQPKPCYYRSTTGSEVDLVLEAPDGRLVAIEVKASSSVTSKDFKGLRALGAVAPERFWRGVVLYTGDQVIPFAERLHAAPIHMLWNLPG
jgi:hypothetical protein